MAASERKAILKMGSKHSPAPSIGAKLGNSLSCVNTECESAKRLPLDLMVVDGRPVPVVPLEAVLSVLEEADITSLSDYRAGRVGFCHRAEYPQCQTAAILVNGTPEPQQLEKARIIHDLAMAWGVDLTLVLALANGFLA